MAEVEAPTLGLPWTLEGQHPWKIECESNVPGIKGLVATVSYRPMAELIIKAVNSLDANEKKLAELREALASVTRELDETLNVTSRAIDQCHGNFQSRTTPSIKAIAAARAALEEK